VNTPTELFAILRESKTMTLATIDLDGSPRATPLYFALEANQVSSGNLVWPFTLLFLSDPSSPHCVNVARDARAAAAVYPGETDWRSLRGVQLKGRVDRPLAQSAASALDTYRREIFIAPELQPAVERSAVYRFIPAWARLIDNRRGFGFKLEWSWSVE
jgi:uncharacterized protein YhbP (UPF0306 family)